MVKSKIVGCGYLEDPVDSRDLPLGSLLGALSSSPPPRKASVRDDRCPPRHQSTSNSCTGQAWAVAYQLDQLRQGKKCPLLSAMHNYYLNRLSWNGQTADIGSYLRTGASAIIQHGIASEEAWKFSIMNINRPPTWAAMKDGHDRKGARGYYRVPAQDADAIRRAIASGHPVVGGWKINDEFKDYNGKGVIPALKNRMNGHAMVIVGYDGEVFDLQNSWGMSYGREGHAFVDQGFIEQGADLWVVDA